MVEEKIDEYKDGETEDDYTIKDDNITTYNVVELTHPTAPAPTLRDLLLKVATLTNDVQSYHSEVSDLLEDMKSLGREVMKNQTALDEQLNMINSAFVGNTANIADLRSELRGTPKSKFVVQQPQRPLEQTTGNYDSLPWKDNQYGQWIFAKNQAGQITPGAEKLTADILASGGKLKNVEGRDYKLSDKFINRSKKK